MCGFPGDYEIRVSMLIKLWMAEGFVKYQVDAEQYVFKFVCTNLVFATDIKFNGEIKSCSVHDLVRDLCKRKAIDENYERRLSNSHLDLRELARAYASTLRTVISFKPNESSLRGLRKFKLLRVLNVVDTDAYSLPASVFDLFHLRYLAFGCPMEVPSAISKLQNLRALIIRPIKRSRKYIYSRDEVYLPLEIWMLPLLTHLVSFFDLLPNPEGGASVMKELVTLSVMKKLICTEEMMKLICNVRKLSITYLVDRYQEEYQLHNLVFLSQLEKLTLVVTKGSLLKVKAKPVFPKRLRKLTLSGWRFPWEDMKAIATLPYLRVLKLRDHAFQGDMWSTIEYGDVSDEEYSYENDKEDGDENDEESDDEYGDENDEKDGNENDEESDEEYGEEDGNENDEESNEEYDEEYDEEDGNGIDELDDDESDEVVVFDDLGYMLIEECDLEKWVTHKHHFRALKRLVLKGCGKLNEIPIAIRYNEELEIIEVDSANVSLLKSAREIQRELEEEYGKVIQVREL